MYDVKIGWAEPSEWPEIMKMVWKTFLEHEGKIYSKEGIRAFFDFITSDELYKSFLSGYYQIMVSRLNGEIVGMCSVRNDNFLSLLFVKEGFQKRGVGTGLVECMKQYLQREAGQTSMLVNAAVGAEDFYLKNGFSSIGEMIDINGVQVTPMEIQL